MTAALLSSRRSATGGATREGFSLVELLVAVTVAMLLLTMLLGVFSSTLDSWTSTSSRSETFGEARAALHLMARELDAVMPQPDERSSISTGLGAPSGNTDEALGFVCKVPVDLQPQNGARSDICGVVYFLGPASDGTQALYRNLLPSTETFSRLQTAVDLFTGADCNPDSSLAEIIAQNVVSFKVRLRDANFKIIEPIADGASGGTPPEAAHIEVVLNVISTREAQNYFDPNTSETQKEKIALKDAREFSLRQPIRRWERQQTPAP